jgi:hypothetical protein
MPKTSSTKVSPTGENGETVRRPLLMSRLSTVERWPARPGGPGRHGSDQPSVHCAKYSGIVPGPSPDVDLIMWSARGPS